MDAGHLTFAPVALIALGFATSLVARGPSGRAARFAHYFGLFSVSLALGLVLDLTRLDSFHPVAFPFDPLGDSVRAVPVWPRLPAAATIAVLALLIAWLWTERPRSWPTAAGQAGALLTLLIAITPGSPGLPALWVSLLLVNLTFCVCHRDLAAPKTLRCGVEPSLVLLSAGAPLLWVSTMIGGTGRVGGVILVLVGAATAGLPPLQGWRTGRSDHRFVEDGLLPVAGYVLAARGFAAGSTSVGLAVLTAALAVAGVAAQGGARRGAATSEGVPVAFGRTLVAAGFAVLAAAFRLGDVAVVAGLSILVAGATVVILAPPPALPSDDIAEVKDPSARARPEGEDDDRDLGSLGWDLTRSAAGRWAALLRVIEQRYDLALGLLVAIIAVFAFSS